MDSNIVAASLKAVTSATNPPIADVLIGIAIGGLAGACAAGADQPSMQAALGSLQQARSYLVQSTPNKGGHRERAINLVNQAINETEAGMAYAGN